MKIKQEYKTNGATYTLLKSDIINKDDKEQQIKAIYKVVFNHTEEVTSTSYEVQILRKKDGFAGKTYRNPANSEFGAFGWSFRTLEKAEIDYANIKS